jgi:two-component system NtrC family sensor kinase
LYLDGRIRSCNEPLAQLAQAKPRELIDTPIGDLLTLPTHEFASELQNVECRLITSSGMRIPVTISTRMLRDRQEMGIGIILVVHDQRELVDLRNRLIVSGRLAAVGELAAGVAHEINNPLTYVRANLSLLRQHWDAVRSALVRQSGQVDDSLSSILQEGDELFDESLEGVDRAASIVRDIKGLSYAGSARHQNADLNALLDSVLRIAAPQIPPTVTIHRDYTQLPMIPCAPQELSQVFLNLVLNAAQAIRGSGEIHIATLREDDSIVVRVADDGCGISPEAADRIFDPFFTTKDLGEGTGLGLAISHEIVRQHGGEITFESREREGADFRVRLPLEAACADDLDA